MTYTPINWQTGDTITAEKMNKMDNGWAASLAVLMSETVTTESGFDGAYGALSYSTPITAETIIVTLNGTAYTCDATVDGSDYIYGDFDFMSMPFAIISNAEENGLSTPEAGTYEIAIAVSSVEVSSQFTSAVNSAIPELIPPFRLIEDETAISEYVEARNDGRLCYLYSGATQYLVVSQGVPSSGQTPLIVSPTPNNISFAFDSDGVLRSIIN